MKKPSKERHIIFDFDGVIVDTYDLCHHLTTTYDQLSLPHDQYVTLFDGNLFEHPLRPQLKSFDDEGLKKQFFEAYAEGIQKHEIVAGMQEVLNSLVGKGQLHIVTNGHSDIIRDFLMSRGIGQHFKSVLGYQVAESKVKKFKMLGLHGEEVKNHLFVTDTLGDLRAAAEIGLPTIAVAWGFHDAQRLEKGNPLAIVRTPAELIQSIREAGF